MILRRRRGRADRARADAYPDHFRTRVVPDPRHVPGFLGADLLQRERQDHIEFTVLTRWSSMQAIRSFAGNPISKAVVEPGAVAALLSYDADVEHYEVVQQVHGIDAEEA